MRTAIPPAADAHTPDHWLEAAIRECQIFVGSAVLLGEPSDVRQLAKQLVARLPDPGNRAEDLMLRGLLLDIAAKWGRLLHDRAHARSRRPCHFVDAAMLDLFWNRTHQPAKQVFTEWADAFSRGFAAVHPLSPAQRAAAAIRRSYGRSWRVSELAEQTGVTPSQLRRVFRREYGIGIPEYQGRVRLLSAIKRIVDRRVTVDSVAREVGFRSKKNFYRRFKQLTGLTPTQFRQLPRPRQRDLVESMRFSMVSRPAASAPQRAGRARTPLPQHSSPS